MRSSRSPAARPAARTSAASALQRHDADTGLIDLNARWYDPVIGLFVNPDDFDPIDADTAVAGGATGWLANPVGTNRYAYAGNDPVNKADPNGQSVSETASGAVLPKIVVTAGDGDRAADTEKARNALSSSGPRAGGGISGTDNWNPGSTAEMLDFDPILLLEGYPCACGLGGIPRGGGARGGGGYGFRGLSYNRGAFERYKDLLRKAMQRPSASDANLNRILDKAYRDNATVGSGSTAAAVRAEQATGQPVAGKFHTQKANELVTSLQNWLKSNPTASPGDRAAAENVMIDLQNALSGK